MITPKSVSFVVPCFNEEDNVAATVQSIRRAVEQSYDYEIILVDDCSSDRTWERMRELAADDPRIRPLRNEANSGLGGSYKRGIATARMAYAILVPGDDGFPSASIAEILSHMGEADIVVPEVGNPGVRAPLRVFASRAFTAIVNGLFLLDIRYYNGAVLHRTDLLQQIEITTNSFAYQAEALVKLVARGASYVHCQVRIQERAGGRSSALKLKNQIAVWKTLLHLLGTVGLFRIRARWRRRRRAAIS
jgi:dolichol-phosphate mannosyltransferase